MQIKEIPLGQVLMLGLPIFLMVIGIAAIIFLTGLVTCAIDKLSMMASKVLKWYHNLVK